MFFLGIGVTYSIFHGAGHEPVLVIELYMSRRGNARKVEAGETSAGKISLPTIDLGFLNFLSLLMTEVRSRSGRSPSRE